MPKIYRGMKQDQGKPALGTTATTLGVRIPADIKADANGLVHPGTGGMSVAPTLQMLPVHRVPKRLQTIFPRAGGSNELCVWSMGTGNFADAFVTARLFLRIDPENVNHGFVEPAVSMSPEDYQSVLSATHDSWVLDEE